MATLHNPPRLYTVGSMMVVDRKQTPRKSGEELPGMHELDPGDIDKTARLIAGLAYEREGSVDAAVPVVTELLEELFGVSYMEEHGKRANADDS